MAQYRIGLSRDLLDASGRPTCGEEAFRVLDEDPALLREWFGDGHSAVTEADIAAFDAICLGAPPLPADCLGKPRGRTRLVARFGVGIDHCDVDAMTEHGV